MVTLNNNLFFGEVERLLSDGEDVTIMVRGNSMRPLLRDGRDKVVVRCFCGENIALGDVMLFRYNGGYIMHRVVRIEGDRIVFAGDGNYKRWEIAARRDVVARIVAVIRPSGRRVNFDSQRWRTLSTAWLVLPQIVRRVILGVLRRIK